MFIEHNRIVEKLKQGKIVCYSSLLSGSSDLAELMGYCGVDYVRIDMEHHPLDISVLKDCIRAVQLSGAAPIVRVPDHQEGTILRILEAGALGIQAAHIDTAEEAARVVEMVKFPPLGKRGFSGGSRSGGFGLMPVKDYLRYAAENILVIAQIESKKGVENIEEIVKSGVDIITQGPSDLSVDMGFGGRKTKELEEAIAHVHAVCRAANIPYVAYNFKGTQESFNQCYQEGARIFSVASDLAILKAKISMTMKEMNAWEMQADNIG